MAGQSEWEQAAQNFQLSSESALGSLRCHVLDQERGQCSAQISAMET